MDNKEPKTRKKGNFISDFFGVFKEKTMIRSAKYQKQEHVFLLLRNTFVFLAAIAFVISFFRHGRTVHILRSGGYIMGAFAYFSEILMETEGFTKKLDYDDMFMAYWFCPIYIMMAISYILEAFHG